LLAIIKLSWSDISQNHTNYFQAFTSGKAKPEDVDASQLCKYSTFSGFQ
jgi:hypothetical protein